jgi:hypothetical protein
MRNFWLSQSEWNTVAAEAKNSSETNEPKIG